MKRHSLRRPLILADLLLILLPCVVTFLEGTDGAVSAWIIGSGVVSALMCLVTLHISRKQLETAGSEVSGTILLLIPVLQYAFTLIMVAVTKYPDLNPSWLTSIILGLMFIVMGNILPKSQPNPVFGVRTRWSMANRENWIRTSRISGYLWVIGGLLCWLGVLMKLPMGISLILVLVIALAPVIVSYLIYRRQKQEGTWTEDPNPDTGSMQFTKPMKILTGVILAASAILILLVITVGSQYSINVDSGRLRIDAVLVPDCTFELDRTESLVLKEAGDPGYRSFGYSAGGINLGNYQNDEYGNYSRYTGKSPVVIELKGDDRTLVLSLSNQEATEKLYETLKEAIQNEAGDHHAE